MGTVSKYKPKEENIVKLKKFLHGKFNKQEDKRQDGCGIGFNQEGCGIRFNQEGCGIG